MKNEYYLSVVACFINEADYMKEWIDFHLLMGVNHFYLYDTGIGTKYMPDNHHKYVKKYVKRNGFPMVAEKMPDGRYTLLLDNPLEILQPYIDQGLVTYHSREIFDQIDIYNHAFRTYGSSNVWMAFIDLDEFLHPADKNLDLKKILKTYEKYPSIAVHSLFFGSSGEENKSSTPLVERFTYRANDNCEIKGYNDLTKVIAQPSFIKKFKNAHSCKLIGGLKGVNTHREIVPPKALLRPIYHDVLRVNHYHIKSKEEFLTRHAFGRHSKTADQNLDRFIARDNICNQIKDSVILDVIKNKKNDKN